MTTTIAARAQRRFEWLCKDLHRSDIESLFAVERLRSKLLTYDYQTQTCKPVEKDLPWPIVWLLARSHPKFVLAGATPKPELVTDQVKIFLNRVAWRMALRDDDYKPPFRLSRPSKTMTCREPLPQAFSDWSESFLESFATQYEHVYNKIRPYDRSTRTLRLVSLAIRMLKDRNVTVLQSDKDGGFILVPRSDLESIERKILCDSSTYVYEDGGMVVATLQAAERTAATLADGIGIAMSDPNLSAYIMRPMHRVGRTAVATLGMTVKSHKPPGDVVPRQIHGILGYSFEGHAKWLSGQIREHLGDRSHLVADSQAAKRLLGAVALCGDDDMVKLDIKDFFLSGSLAQIKNTTREALRSHPSVNLICEVVELLVYNQYVVGRHYATCAEYGAFRVRKGSGMGLLHSGDLADLLFDHLVDGWALRASTRQGLGIRAYVRFKDDCLVLMDGFRTDLFFDMVKARAKFFTVKLEEINHYRVSYLNLSIIKAGTRLVFRHYTKPTAMSIPLSSLSGQPRNVHSSWPTGMVKTIYALSSRVADARDAATQLRERFSTSTVPFIVPDVSPVVRPHPRRSRVGTMWMPLKYHPSVARPLQRILNTCLHSGATILQRGVAAFLDVKTVSIAWANCSKPLYVKLRR